MSGTYDSARLAAGYAFHRPPVHERILQSIPDIGYAQRALDVGCGAGLSTRALVPYAQTVTGLEPMPAMLAHRGSVAPSARFVVGSAERLPFAANSFDLLGAAGSLNYVDLPSFLAQARRVLHPDGRVLVYDFGEGRHPALEEWMAEFALRCPHPPGWRPLDVREVDWAQAGLRLTSYRDLDVTVALGLEAYQRYVLSEVNVDNAIRVGLTTEEQIRAWSTETLTPIFAGKELQLQFRGYAGIAGPAK